MLLLAQTALVAGLATIAPQAPPPTEAWREAERRIVRLEPAAFPDLPKAIIAVLEARGCRIPQTARATGPENVISGHFFDDPRPLDWAVLCSRNGRSAVLVIPGDVGAELLPPDGRTIVELNEQPDADFLQASANDRIGFARSLSTATATTITEYARHANTSPPSLLHDGIEDALAGKSSVIWYRYAGRWLELAGR